MKKYNYLVVGGGLAGGKALEAIRQADENGSIALVAREPRRPYQRPPLSKKVIRGETDLEEVYLQESEYYQQRGIDIYSGVRAVELNSQEHKLRLENNVVLEFSKLLLATGGDAVRLDLPGSDLERVFTLREVEESLAIRNAVSEGTQVLIMGGSFIGCETAASLAQIGGNILQIFPEERLLEHILPEGASRYLKSLFEAHDIELMPGTIAKEIQGENTVKRVVLDTGQVRETDLVVMGVGIKLNTGLAKKAGLKVRQQDQAVIVDRYLETSEADIYAAGDIAAWPSDRYGGLLRVEHWDVARRQGLLAGSNMAGNKEVYDSLPYFFSDIFDLNFEVWGNLSSWDRTAVRGSYPGKNFAISYFSGSQLVGILSAGRPDDEREPIQNLVKIGADYEQIAAGFKDEDHDLAQLAGNLSG